MAGGRGEHGIDAGGLVVAQRDGAEFSDDEIERIGHRFPNSKAERNGRGEAVIRPPLLDEGGAIAVEVSGQAWLWTRGEGFGRAYDAEPGYDLPIAFGGLRQPDVAWLSDEQLALLPPVSEREHYPRFAPAFAVEILSRGQSPASQLAKIDLWSDAGSEVAWLIDPFDETVYVKRRGAEREAHRRPAALEVGPELPGLVIEFERIWSFTR